MPSSFFSLLSREAFVRPWCSLVRMLLGLCLRVRVIGAENLLPADGRVLFVANHVSLLDALLLSAVLPRGVLFAAPAGIVGRRWMLAGWRARNILDQANPKTAKAMVEALKAGRSCLIFPEGRASRTGALMKVYESPGMIADKADAAIVPIRIDGPQYSYFSAARGLPRRLFPKTTISILPPRKLMLPEAVKGHRRRHLAGAALTRLMETAMVEGAPISTLMRQLLASKRVRGAGGLIVEDASRVPLNHRTFVARAFALGRTIHRILASDEAMVGVMLPNSTANAVAIFAVQAAGRAAAMMNFSAGAVRMVQACKMAKIETVISSRGFVAALHLEASLAAFAAENIRVLYLEDVVPCAWDRVCAGVRARLPVGLAAHGLPADPDAPAIVLFTSGTEGLPKGVVLSHRAVIVNGLQFGVHVGFTASDVVFAQLPMFHSFGLTLGFFLPVFIGTRTFLFPSPLRYHDIPEQVYDSGATFMLGTDTFLANYARNAAQHDFYFLRYCIGGAERIKAETRRLWAEKFGVRLLEGYGTTETAPVISANAPMAYKPDTVGKVVPGIEARIQPVAGITAGGELCVRGPNVMLGYLKADKPGTIQPLQDGWYNTGDVASIDDDGFITILGRTKRFAKVGGEMVSLGAIEAVVGGGWPDARHVAVCVPEARRGEAVVLLTEADDVDLSRLAGLFRDAGLTELSLPRRLIKVSQIPLLGSGKTDYAGARVLAMRAEPTAE